MTVSSASIEDNVQRQEVNENKQRLLLFLQDVTGADFSKEGGSDFSLFGFFEIIANMVENGGIDGVMERMKAAIDNLRNENPDATTEEKLGVVSGVARELAEGEGQAQNQDLDVGNVQSQDNGELSASRERNLGGVNGTAVTYEVSKIPDFVVEGSDIKLAIQEGNSIITSIFANNVWVAGSMVDATIDRDMESLPNFEYDPQLQIDNDLYSKMFKL